VPSKYQQIEAILRERILDGTYPSGSEFPARSALQREFGVSSRVIVDAVRPLVEEGLIDTKPGTSSTVCGEPDVIRMARAWYDGHVGTSPWRASMAAIGREGSWTSESEPTAAPAPIAKRLGIEPGARVMRTDYTFTLDGRPAFLSRSFEPMALTGGTDMLLPEGGPHAGKGVYERMRLLGRTPTFWEEEVLTHDLTPSEADALRLRVGSRALLIWRTYFDGAEPDLRPLETADIILPRGIRPRYRFPIGNG